MNFIIQNLSSKGKKKIKIKYDLENFVSVSEK
jgi:hypothetical protein